MTNLEKIMEIYRGFSDAKRLSDAGGLSVLRMEHDETDLWKEGLSLWIKAQSDKGDARFFGILSF